MLRGALLAAGALLLSIAAPAGAVTRFAVAGGTASNPNCTSTGDDCSLRHVFEDVVVANDEVVVMPGTHDFGTTGVTIRSAGRPLNIHGQAGQPRPSIVADAAFVLAACTSPCAGDNFVFRHLQIQNKTKGSGLDFHGGAAGSPATVDDVVVVLGTSGMVNGNGLLARSQTGIPNYAVVRNTTVFAPGAGPNVFAIGSGVNMTLRNVTAVATGSNAYALSQGANCGDGTCDAQSTVINSILDGSGPGGADVRTILSGAMPPHLANVALDYSNFDSVITCAGCTVSAPGSAHNQTAAAQLVNKAAGDFHELAASPTIDAGLDDPLNGLTDLDGNPRALGAATDIGAFETAGPGTPGAGNPNQPGGTPTTPGQTGFVFNGITLQLKSFTLTVNGKTVTFTILCPVGVVGNCTGGITLQTASRVLLRTDATAAKKKKKKKVKLGSATFSIPAGTSKAVKVKLSKVALRLLKRSGKLKAVATITSKANGISKKQAAKITLKQKKKKKR
jgi:hypothetical protein